MIAGGLVDVLPDILQPDLALVFCGSAASRRSASRGAYYAGPGNRFWIILHKVGLTAECLAPEDYASVLKCGIGLTDLAKKKSGADSALSAKDYDRRALAVKIERYAPRWLAFNGKRAASLFLGRPVVYGRQEEVFISTGIFVLPSTSGAARGFWHEEPWWQLAEEIKRLGTSRSC